MKNTRNASARWLSICSLIIAITTGCGQVSSPESAAQASNDADQSVKQSVSHTATIRLPPPVHGAVFRVASSEAMGTKQEAFLKCAACHGLRPPNSENSKSSHMDEFHQGLKISHGQLTCVSCHNANDNYSSLKLADGRTVPFEESMTLCAQCHGPQYRDYEHGAHGGMSGYWDLRRGERVRNHCQHCHDPHVPSYPKFRPAPPPQDRFKPSHSTLGSKS